MKPTLRKSEEFWIAMVAALAAFTLGANHSTQVDALSFVGNYLYWIVRIFIQSALFFAVLTWIERYFKHRMSEWLRCFCAILLSLIPFTLSVTALDIIVGLPELGLDDTSNEPISRGWAFCLEMLYLLDNHIALGLLLLVPRFTLRARGETEQDAKREGHYISPTEDLQSKEMAIPQTFFESLDPPLEGRICSMEAQEHYILVTTTVESRMVLHRFSDAVQRTPDTQGMQVHRSHWVSHQAVQYVTVEGQSMKLKLIDDRMIPVSRTYRTLVESKYSG